MAINGPKLRGISWNAIVKGNGILGACFPDVEHRCFPNSYGYITYDKSSIVIMLENGHRLQYWVA